MNLKEISWNKNNYKDYQKYLISLKDIEYKNFHSKLTNTNYEIIGIRVPIMKRIAKEICKGDIESYFELSDFNYYEEVMIYGLVLSSSEEKYIDKYLYKFISYVDNWAICDSFCSNLKIVRKKLGKYWIYFNSLIDLNKEFNTRISLVIFMNYYLCDNYIDRVLKIVSNINSDYYYINMAISWLLSVAIIDYQDKVLELLKSKKLSKFVQNKTISKIRDSYRISKEIKDLVKEYRIV